MRYQDQRKNRRMKRLVRAIKSRSVKSAEGVRFYKTSTPIRNKR